MTLIISKEELLELAKAHAETRISPDKLGEVRFTDANNEDFDEYFQVEVEVDI